MKLVPKLDFCSRGLLCVALTLITTGNTAISQTDTPAVPEFAVPDVAEIEAKKASVEGDSSVGEATKTGALQFYERALEATAQSKDAVARNSSLIEKIETAAARREQLLRRLEKGGGAAGPVQLSDGAKADEIRELGDRTKAQLDLAREVSRTRAKELAELKTMGTSSTDQIVQTEAELEQLAAEFEQAPGAGEVDALSEARRTFLEAQRAKLQNEQQWLQRQLANLDLLVSLAALEQDAADLVVERLETQSERLQTALEERRSLDAEQARRDAEAVMAATTMLPAPVAALAKTNFELRTELEELSAKTREVSQQRRSTENRLEDVEQELETVRARVETWGSSPAVGRLLRRRLERLPSPLDYGRDGRVRQDDINVATDRRIDIEEQTTDILSVDQQVDALVSPLSSKDSPGEESWLREQTRDLVTAQRNTLAELSEAYRRYLAELIALDASELKLVTTVEETRNFIKEKLVWIRSLGPLRGADFAELPGALSTLTAAENWRQALTGVRNELTEHPLGSALGLAVIAAIFMIRRRVPAALAELGGKTRQIRSDSFAHTLKALAYTLTAASAWPLTIAYVGWHFHSTATAEFSAAIGAGLLGLAAFLFSVSAIRWVLCPGGLAQSHFRWPKPIAESLSRELRWLGMVAWVVVPVTAVTDRLGDPTLVEGVGRPVFIAGLVALTFFVWRVLGPTSPFTAYFARNHPEIWVVRLRFLWFSFVALTPLVLALASAIGYEYTAETFARLLVRETVWFLGSLLLLRALLLRWFLLAERRLRLESAIRHRKEARQEREQEERPEAEIFDIEVPVLDYKELGGQARVLVRVGVFVGVFATIFGLWGEFVPFYAYLENFTLPYTKTNLADGVEVQMPATLADLGLGLLLLTATGLAAKNLPGLLEFTALRYFRVDAGARYALLTLCQYAIVTLGVIMAFSAMGMEWQKLQWLVAALGVGLGFGLQEIVANFVSGIILLVERPIRVGDIVTVGNASGAVSRIQIRATTIQTYDSQELLVPNKEFITGQLLNWTLTDQVARILLYVGVAYGSDVEKALRLLLDAAVEEERVLDDPGPSVNFEGFGDNALNLSLRAYVGSLDYRLATQTALHKSIYAKFAAAGIEIAFPQRDVHLDARGPLQVRVLGRDAEGD